MKIWILYLPLLMTICIVYEILLTVAFGRGWLIFSHSSHFPLEFLTVNFLITMVILYLMNKILSC